jgi:hypothetical protein
MRRAAQVDRNQTEIVDALRLVGATVAITSALGDGYPDLTVGFRGQTHLLEVKDPLQPASARQLTPAQKLFHTHWQGRKPAVVHTPDEALRAIGALR